MRLNEFGKQRPGDIIHGVTEAQEKTKLCIGPGIVEGEKISPAQTIEIAVTVNSTVGGGSGVFGVGDVKAALTWETANPISYEVPIYFNASTRSNRRHYMIDGPLNPVA